MRLAARRRAKAGTHRSRRASNKGCAAVGRTLDLGSRPRGRRGEGVHGHEHEITVRDYGPEKSSLDGAGHNGVWLCQRLQDDDGFAGRFHAQLLVEPRACRLGRVAATQWRKLARAIVTDYFL